MNLFHHEFPDDFDMIGEIEIYRREIPLLIALEDYDEFVEAVPVPDFTLGVIDDRLYGLYEEDTDNLVKIYVQEDLPLLFKDLVANDYGLLDDDFRVFLQDIDKAMLNRLINDKVLEVADYYHVPFERRGTKRLHSGTELGPSRSERGKRRR